MHLKALLYYCCLKEVIFFSVKVKHELAKIIHLQIEICFALGKIRLFEHPPSMVISYLLSKIKRQTLLDCIQMAKYVHIKFHKISHLKKNAISSFARIE